jgi:hypothetical protein
MGRRLKSDRVKASLTRRSQRSKVTHQNRRKPLGRAFPASAFGVAQFAEIAAERFIGSSLSNRPKPAATRRCMHDLRDKLVDLALSWEQAFGNAPHITAALSEFDAAQLVGCSIDQYCKCMRGGTSVRRGHDFQFNGRRYQVKANRPSGKPGSFVTLVPKVRNYDWDVLVWILYDKSYQIEEAWLWEVEPYRKAFESIKRLSPIHYRQGKRLQ